VRIYYGLNFSEFVLQASVAEDRIRKWGGDPEGKGNEIEE